jgi:ribose 5-phosphate isomerase A
MMNDTPKAHAARAALDYVKDGMVLGLGSGSTAELFIELLGLRVADGLNLVGVPTSRQSADAAKEAGIKLLPIEHAERIDLTVDGADEIGPKFTLIKGGGGCLLREKIIANASDLMVVIADESKMVRTLGAYPLPVEVDRFGFSITAKKVFDALEASAVSRPGVVLRQDKRSGKPFITDGGHCILDCACGSLDDPARVAANLCAVPGVVEHGLFINLTRIAIIGGENDAEILER